MEPASSMGKSPRKLLGTIKNELNNERHLSSERLKTLLEQIERLVNSKGIDVIILNQGAELFKTALHKTEDPAVLEYCLKSAENPNFKYNKVAKDRMLTFVRKHYDDNNLTKVFAFWPTYFAPSLIVIFVEHVLPKLDNQQKEELYKLISHAFQYGENDHLRNIAFRLLIGLKIKIPIETNSKSVSRQGVKAFMTVLNKLIYYLQIYQVYIDNEGREECRMGDVLEGFGEKLRHSTAFAHGDPELALGRC